MPRSSLFNLPPGSTYHYFSNTILSIHAHVSLGVLPRRAPTQSKEKRGQVAMRILLALKEPRGYR